MSTLGPAGAVLGAPGATLGNLLGAEPPAPWAAFEGAGGASSVDDGHGGASSIDDGAGALVGAFG
jgi:hypothetical protein